MTHATPCAHLLTTPQPVCELELGFPRHCRGCRSYLPGINLEERTRSEVWSVVAHEQAAAASGRGEVA